MWIRDNDNGEVHKYGTNRHDSLVISQDGRTLTYYNLQNGDGSKYGGYSFTDENGNLPIDDEDLQRYGANAYFNIGGFDDLEKIAETICENYCRYPYEWDEEERGQTLIDGVCVNCPLGCYKNEVG